VSADRGISELADRGGGRCELSGELTLASVPWLWQELSEGGLLGGAREADLAGVAAADSAGLALLVAWKAECRRNGGELRFSAVPPRLAALAALTGAQDLLQGAA
jgi:anti-anti-sigma factor